MRTKFLIACHIAVFVIFGGAAWLHYSDRTFLRWEFVVLVSLASLPFLLPLLACYIEEIGENRLKLRLPFKDDVSVEKIRKLEAEFKRVIPPTAMAQPSEKEKALGVFSPEGRKVLRTLWRFQKSQFGDASDKRWGFGIQPSAPDYSEFRVGATELLSAGLTVEDARGMVFLSDSGIEFGRKNDGGLGGGDVWDKFR